MKATQTLHDLGQSLWLDNITRDLLDSGTLAALHRRALGDRADLEPDDLRPRHQEQRGLRRGDPRRSWRQGKSGEDAVLRTGARGSDPGRRPVPPDPRADRRRRRLGLAGGLAAAGPRHRQHAGRGQGPARAGRPAESVHQDPRHAGRPAGDRGGDLRRRPGQRHAAVLARAVPGRGRGLSARRRAAHRGRARPDVGSVASLFISRWDVAVAARCPTALRNRLGIAIGQRTYKAYRELLASPRWQRAVNAGARPQRLLWASTGTKDPEGLRHPLRQGAGRAVHRQHHARGHAEGLRRPRRGRRASCRPTAATARRCWPSSPRPASTSTRWPPSSRTRAPSPSSSRGTS